MRRRIRRDGIDMTMPITPESIKHWADAYTQNSGEKSLQLEEWLIQNGPSIKERGYLTLKELKEFVTWKTRNRATWCCEYNDEDFVEEVSRVSLSTTNEQLRIEALTLLHGVDYPVASSILHLVFGNDHPIQDVRALESLDMKRRKGERKFEFWTRYRTRCLEIADQCGVDMRTLDRALWQYSKDNQNE